MPPFAVCCSPPRQAGEQQRTRIEIAIDDDAASEQSFVFDSQDAGFDLQSMLVGESRSVTDRSGSTADIRRTEDGFEIDVNGKTIDLPDMHGHDGAQGEHEIELMMDDTDADRVAIKKVRMIKSDSANGVTIISGSEIGPETRERIAEALKEAGSGRRGRSISTAANCTTMIIRLTAIVRFASSVKRLT